MSQTFFKTLALFLMATLVHSPAFSEEEIGLGMSTANPSFKKPIGYWDEKGLGMSLEEDSKIETEIGLGMQDIPQLPNGNTENRTPAADIKRKLNADMLKGASKAAMIKSLVEVKPQTNEEKVLTMLKDYIRQESHIRDVLPMIKTPLDEIVSKIRDFDTSNEEQKSELKALYDQLIELKDPMAPESWIAELEKKLEIQTDKKVPNNSEEAQKQLKALLDKYKALPDGEKIDFLFENKNVHEIVALVNLIKDKDAEELSFVRDHIVPVLSNDINPVLGTRLTALIMMKSGVKISIIDGSQKETAVTGNNLEVLDSALGHVGATASGEDSDEAFAE